MVCPPGDAAAGRFFFLWVLGEQTPPFSFLRGSRLEATASQTGQALCLPPR